jgi:hypothetical protein
MAHKTGPANFAGPVWNSLRVCSRPYFVKVKIPLPSGVTTVK